MEPLILIHGGAGPDSDFIKQNIRQYEEGLRQALGCGYQILTNGGTALDAVEAAVICMEENELFNAGRGSALNEACKVEMCSSIMDGSTLKYGASSLVKTVRNPISLSKKILLQDGTGCLAGAGALKFAEEHNMATMDEGWFITAHQKEVYEETLKSKEGQHGHGTVGAVALDMQGNIAAATSTGGLDFSREGRLADSGMIGIGCYANNDIAAISCTGDGEKIIELIMAHSIASEIKYTNKSLQEAADQIIHIESNKTDADLGAILLNKKGEYAFCYHSERMHRGKQNASGTEVFVY